MKVGWLMDPPQYIGGAELTQAEFRAAVPEGVEVVDCPPGEIADADLYVVHNCTTYAERPAGVRYLHDMRGGIVRGDRLIFCSPLQREEYGKSGVVVPPAINLARFKTPRQSQKRRKGNVAIGSWYNPGKGQQLLREWSNANGLLTVYGGGSFIPIGPNIDYRGPLEPDKVPQTLWGFERFVHLPTAIEPFGRCVIEAWAAGCQLVINRLVGAGYWVKRRSALESAAENFWKVALGE